MRHLDALSSHPLVAVIRDDLLETVKKTQIEDKHCNLIRELLQAKGTYRDYEIRQDVLYRFVAGEYLLVVPKVMQAQLIGPHTSVVSSTDGK